MKKKSDPSKTGQYMAFLALTFLAVGWLLHSERSPPVTGLALLVDDTPQQVTTTGIIFIAIGVSLIASMITTLTILHVTREDKKRRH